MTSPGPAPLNNDEVFAPTEKGNRELKSSDTPLSATEMRNLCSPFKLAPTVNTRSGAAELESAYLALLIRLTRI